MTASVRCRAGRVCITGATGFLGGAVARALVKQGADVHVLARHSSDRGPLADVPVTWHCGDIRLPQTLGPFFEGASEVIHAAGHLGRVGLPESEYQLTNVEGTRNVLMAAQAVSARVRVLHLSTAGVLGPTASRLPAEDAPLAPSNAYERSKAAAEQIALEFAARGLAVIIARPAFVYGPGDRHVLGLFRAIKGGHFFFINGGRCVCHPTFIDDAVTGMLLSLSHGRPGEAYHITGTTPATFRQLAETIAAAMGVEVPRLSIPRWLASTGAVSLEVLSKITGRLPALSRTGVAFFSENRAFSSAKAHRELGYTPQYQLTKGIERTVAWYRQHGWIPDSPS
jgi:nucleoside-diphosphate-sugar epimerase